EVLQLSVELGGLRGDPRDRRDGRGPVLLRPLRAKPPGEDALLGRPGPRRGRIPRESRPGRLLPHADLLLRGRDADAAGGPRARHGLARRRRTCPGAARVRRGPPREDLLRPAAPPGEEPAPPAGAGGTPGDRGGPRLQGGPRTGRQR